MRKIKMYSGDASDARLLEKLLRDLVAAQNEAIEAFIEIDARLGELEENVMSQRSAPVALPPQA